MDCTIIENVTLSNVYRSWWITSGKVSFGLITAPRMKRLRMKGHAHHKFSSSQIPVNFSSWKGLYVSQRHVSESARKSREQYRLRCHRGGSPTDSKRPPLLALRVSARLHVVALPMYVCSCGLSPADGESLLILTFGRLFMCARVCECVGGHLFLIWTSLLTGGVGGEHFGYLATSRGHGCDPSVCLVIISINPIFS